MTQPAEAAPALVTATVIPTNDDILRFCNALLVARADYDTVTQLINQELADQPEFLHSTYLMVVLRTVITEFYAPAVGRLDREVGGNFTDAGLALQRAVDDKLLSTVRNGTWLSQQTFAGTLIEQGDCSAKCLLALWDTAPCQCACEGAYHGVLADIPVVAKETAAHED